MGGLLLRLRCKSGGCQIPTLLLAPAMGVHTTWKQRLGSERFDSWARDGTLSYFHEGARDDVHLPFSLWTQCRDETNVRVDAPTVVIHGRHDEVVPIQGSYDFAQRSPSVRAVIEVDAGHGLNEHLEVIFRCSDSFRAQLSLLLTRTTRASHFRLGLSHPAFSPKSRPIECQRDRERISPATAHQPSG